MRFTKSTITAGTPRPHRFRKPRRACALLLALMLLPFGALASDIPSTMRVALISPSDLELYPLRVMDRDMTSLLGLVYESLIRIDDNRQPSPGLAESWSVQPDGRSWIFQIRQGVQFHDGRPLTAYDVQATMDAIAAIAADETLAANQKGLYSGVPGICSSWTADSDYQLTVRTKYPTYGLLYAMTFPVLQAQSVMTVNPPGSGPYRVEYYAPGKEIWLGAFPGYYGLPPYVTELEGIFCQSDEDALRRFEAEEVDIVMTRSSAALRYRGTASTRTSSYDFSTRQLECLMINNYQSNPPLKDAELRKAISLSINKKQLENNIYQGLMTSTETLQAPVSWLHNKSVDTHRYSPEEAGAILDKMGWDNWDDSQGAPYRMRRNDAGETVLLELRLCYYDEAGSNLRKEAADAIARMLRDVGFRVRLYDYTFDEAATKLTSGDYDLFLCAYNFDVVPDPSFILLQDGRANYARYRSEKMTELCRNLRNSAEADDFKQNWDSIQALLHEDIAFLPLYFRGGVVLTRYPYSNIRDIREYELLRSINEYNR